VHARNLGKADMVCVLSVHGVVLPGSEHDTGDADGCVARRR
jgi:hypothetical protein